jgi:hypothetical protein
MKAEERKHLKENELANWLSGLWSGKGDDSGRASTLWAVLAVVAIGLIAFVIWRYFAGATANTRASQWVDFEQAVELSQLEGIAESNRNTPIGRTAQAQIARQSLQEGLDRLGSPLTRSAAAAQIEKSRDLYSQIAKDTATDPILLREALLSAAKAEESLVGIPKTDNPTETRGNLDRALEWYQELANRYPDSFQGKEAAKRAKEIQTNKQQIVDFYRLLAKTFAPPELPKLPDAPKVETPKIDIPKPDPLKTETPKGDVPKLDLPKSDSPKTETPKVEPKKEEPKLEPKKEEPKKNAPKTVDPKAGSAK